MLKGFWLHLLHFTLVTEINKQVNQKKKKKKSMWPCVLVGGPGALCSGARKRPTIFIPPWRLGQLCQKSTTTVTVLLRCSSPKHKPNKPTFSSALCSQGEQHMKTTVQTNNAIEAALAGLGEICRIKSICKSRIKVAAARTSSIHPLNWNSHYSINTLNLVTWGRGTWLSV